MKEVDVVVLTERRYIKPPENKKVLNNVFLEDELIKIALEEQGMKVIRLSWDDSLFDWSTTRFILFRSTWDYFERYNEFSKWLNIVSKQTQLINSEEIIRWNVDKHYLLDLERKGIHCVPTIFIEKGTSITLAELYKKHNYNETILKPAVSGTARHTYKLNTSTLSIHEALFQELIAEETMLLQPFQYDILNKGEVSLVLIDGLFTHAVLKVAKVGDFRVQDDFGGSVHDYNPTAKEIAFAEKVIQACNPKPLYARVDVLTDNHGDLALVELELVEPELWFRKNGKAAKDLALTIKRLC